MIEIRTIDGDITCVLPVVADPCTAFCSDDRLWHLSTF
jgi:hypothetical protein